MVPLGTKPTMLVSACLLLLCQWPRSVQADIAERERPSTLLERIPDTEAPNEEIQLDGWAQYHDFYYLAGTNRNWVVGPADQCYCEGWSIRYALQCGLVRGLAC